ncbi:PREDICTED: protein Aatf-like [Dinoponera quadriceps]|uniref:Protein Aatf-like n=1 Tax=Dinoponera quadriceps TaxID=609295 RepID=A0A6P3X577_DINQU|nr:PREDICTED: protein Aatf-like [Dinoponera quadriceps]
MTRAMMSDSKMPHDFWAEAVCTAVHIKNRIKSTVHGRTPFEVWNGRKPNVKYLRRFWYVAYLLDKEGKRKKFDSKTTKGIFVGYAANHTYRIFVPTTGRIKTDWDVKFDECRRGYGILNEEEKGNQMNCEKLIIGGLDAEDETNEIQQEEIEEDVEDGRTETGSTEYGDAETEEFDQKIQHENEDDPKEDENIEDVQVQPTNVRSRGRPKGTTKAIIEVRKRILEEERRQERENVRRLERIKGQQKANARRG